MSGKVIISALTIYTFVLSAVIMIKLYFDWNVLSQMKNGHHNELKDIVFNNDKFFIPFSTSHISDILTSYRKTEDQIKIIDSDLEFISQLTDNKCLFINSGEVKLDFYPPQELFQQRIEEKDLFNDTSLDGIIKTFLENGDPENNIEKLKVLSSSFDEGFRKAFENPQAAEQLDKIFPGLIDNPTLEGLFSSINKMRIGLNEGDQYKDLRELVQTGLGINRDRIFNAPVPFQIIEKEYEKLGVTPKEYISDTKFTPKWYNDISNEYILLDMHGYQEDKVNVKKGRKETFKNTIEDAAHCAFASTCNFYVINDNKSYKKAKKIYEKLQINTLVLKPEEFVAYYKAYLALSDNWLNLTLPFEFIKSEEFISEKLERGTLRTYFLPYFLFDFFNKIFVLFPDDGGKPALLLSRFGVTNNRGVYVFEIKRLFTKISELFGPDIDNLGQVEDEEITQKEWNGRRWKLNEMVFKLVHYNGRFQFYFDCE